MSHERAIDGEEVLFDFDAVEDLNGSGSSTGPLVATPEQADLSDMSHIPSFCNLDLSSFTAPSTPAEVVDFISKARTLEKYERFVAEEENEQRFKGKGKAVSQPMDIQPRDSVDEQFDSFSYSSILPGSSRGRRISSVPSSSTSTPQTLASFAFSPSATPYSYSGSYRTNITSPGTSYVTDSHLDDENESKQQLEDAKAGKSRADPPILPPLTFSPTEFAQGETSWPLSCSSPEGLAPPDIHNAASAVAFPTNSPSSSHAEAALDDSPFTHRTPSRTRSFSSLSTKSAKSLAAMSMTKIKQSLGKGKRPSNLARKLLLRKGDDITCIDLEPEDSAPANTPTEATHKLHGSVSEPASPFITATNLLTDSSVDHADICDASREIATLDYFDMRLPKEVKLAIFKALLALHESDGQRIIRGTEWTALTAAKEENRWLGRNMGFIELVRISRVCKSWQELVFDGQLWDKLDLQAFPTAPAHLLLRLAAASGSFVRAIDFTGHTRLSASSLVELTTSFCYNPPSRDQLPATQLTHINLSGCISLNTHALHDLLTHSPLVVSLNMKGSPIVTNSTCKILAKYCQKVIDLDLSRCPNVDASEDGIMELLSPHRIQGTSSPLKTLRIAGLRRVSDALLSQLGRFAPDLEVLDLSGARELRNSALEAFVQCSDDEAEALSILLTSREAGREPGDPTKYRRRITKLRHLSLSCCLLISDMACSHLAHAVPKLEFLELAGIRSELRDEGLIHLLSTTPLIRCLDLEEACEITDATLAALTPQLDHTQAIDPTAPEPGSRLEQLNLSYAVHLTNDAVLSLIRACTRLKILEVDNTRVSGTTVKEFVRLSRKRQIADAEVVAVDCRSVGESTVKDLVGNTRTRKGWRAWDARKLHYLDGRDEEGLDIGQDECDERRVALKTFYSWQTVDAVEAARKKKRRASKKGSQDSRIGNDDDYFSIKRSSSKWWAPGGRRSSGSTSPTGGPNFDRDRESCIIM